MLTDAYTCLQTSMSFVINWLQIGLFLILMHSVGNRDIVRSSTTVDELFSAPQIDCIKNYTSAFENEFI